VHRITKLYFLDARKEGVSGLLVFIKVRKTCLLFLLMLKILRFGYPLFSYLPRFGGSLFPCTPKPVR
jgi:hypothetical protein